MGVLRLTRCSNVSSNQSKKHRLYQSVLAGVIATGSFLNVCAADAEPVPGRQRELVRLVRQDCGSCHGLTLQGGLGPALLPTSLHDKPLDFLTFVIMRGRPGTAMPPCSRFLSDNEALWIADQLQKGFPNEQ